MKFTKEELSLIATAFEKLTDIGLSLGVEMLPKKKGKYSEECTEQFRLNGR